MDAKVDKLDEGLKIVAQMLEKLLADPGYVQNLREGNAKFSASLYDKELREALEALRRGGTRQKRETQRTLVWIALAFVRDGNEYAQVPGLMILDQLIAYSSARDVVMKNPSVVRILLSLAGERPSDKVVRWMLEHLVERPMPFFEQLESLSKDARYHPTIAATGLVPWIVKSAEPVMVDSKDSKEGPHMQFGDEHAMHVLVEIAKSNECKPAIAQAGGIAALVAIYQLLEMSEDEVNPIIVKVIGVLAGLAEDDACREQFAAAHGVWPLLDFLWKCSTIQERPEIDEQDHDVLRVRYPSEGTPEVRSDNSARGRVQSRTRAVDLGNAE